MSRRSRLAIAVSIVALLGLGARQLATTVELPFELATSMGQLPAIDGIHKFGRNSDIDTTSDPEDVYSCADIGGPEFYQFGAVAETLYVSSSNAGDAVDVTIQGLDGNGLEQTETITLAGLTFTALSGTWTRVNRAFNASGTELSGNVYIHADSVDGDANGIPDLDSLWRSCIQPFFNQTLQAVFTVPSNKTAYLRQLCLGVNSTTGAATEVADIHLQTRESGGVFRTQHIMGVASTGAGSECFDFPNPRRYPGGTDIRVRVIQVATNDTDVFATFDLTMWVE